jgi:cysteine desulfurase
VNVAARAYLDHASAAPLRPSVLGAMLPFLESNHGDPGRLHAEGLITRVAVETARQQVADFLGARPREVVFTSSGTEAINTAIWGALRRSARDSHVVASAVEHSAVREAIDREPVEVSIVGVDGVGRCAAPDVASALRDGTALVCVQSANHEVGTEQPIAEICAAVRAGAPDALLFVDACASIGHAAFSFADLGADLVAVSGHKFGAPKGAGALLVRRGLRLPPFVVGGAQERARRGGLENVPAIVGFGAACSSIDLNEEAASARRLIDAAWQAAAAVDGVHRFGDGSLPNLLCFGVNGVEAEAILLGLDQHGVAVHSGSACSSEMLEPSAVLEAMGVDAQHSLRVSVGWTSTDADVARFASGFGEVVGRLRSLRSG